MPVTAAPTPPLSRHTPRIMLPIEEEHENATFRDERSPAELESEAIAAESTKSTSGWTARG